MSCHYNYYVITAELMRRSELHDDLLNNILVFLQLAVNGKTDNIFLMVSLRVCATAANKHKIWIKSSSKKRWQRLKLQSCISAELYERQNNHAWSCSYREFVIQVFQSSNISFCSVLLLIQILCLFAAVAHTLKDTIRKILSVLPLTANCKNTNNYIIEQVIMQLWPSHQFCRNDIIIIVTGHFIQR